LERSSPDSELQRLIGPLLDGGNSMTPQTAVAVAKKGLKKLRASQPFNRVTTSTVRAFLSVTGLHSGIAIKHLHRIGAVSSELPNGRALRLWSKADDWVSNQVYWRGWRGYEPETVQLFFKLATRSRSTIDVGAYVGFFALVAAHANPDGLVYAFEPLAEPYERLRRNVELNQLSNVRCIPSAVGNAEGKAEFYHVPINMPCSSSLSFEFMRSAQELQSSWVPVTTLDTFVQEQGLNHIDLVKIDTESTEPDVLRGMAGTIQRHRPHIVCEVLKGRGSEQAVDELVRSFGYSCYHLRPEGPVLCDRVEGHPSWLNYLFTTLEPDALARL
jgi:FkbM family methyltransferase